MKIRTQIKMIYSRFYNVFYRVSLFLVFSTALLCIFDYIHYRTTGYYCCFIGRNFSTGISAKNAEMYYESHRFLLSPLIDNMPVISGIAAIYLLIAEVNRYFEWHHVVLVASTIVIITFQYV